MGNRFFNSCSQQDKLLTPRDPSKMRRIPINAYKMGVEAVNAFINSDYIDFTPTADPYGDELWYVDTLKPEYFDTHNDFLDAVHNFCRGAEECMFNFNSDYTVEIKLITPEQTGEEHETYIDIRAVRLDYYNNNKNNNNDDNDDEDPQ